MNPLRLLLLGFILAWTPYIRAAEPPNILFILTDDLGINDLRCYGRSDHLTPHLDRLAAEGIRFTSAYCAQPICSPSRAAFLTGKAPARLRLTTYLPGRADTPSQPLLHPSMLQHLPLSEKTAGEYLKERGYRTGWIGKWHLGGKGFLPTDQGFDFFYPGAANTTPSEKEGGKGEYDLTKKAADFLTDHAKERFFLVVSHNTPHINYTAKPDLVPKHSKAFEPIYAALIETLDDSVGVLLRKLDELGLRDNTLVVFTSDNGGLHVPEGKHQRITHNGPFRAGKGYLYEGGLRIPLIVRWPAQVSRGAVIDEPVINTDWLPTILELTGDLVQGLDGSSLKSLLAGSSKSASRTLHWHFPHYTNQGGRPGGAIRQGDWKLIEHYEDNRLELFNLAKDPGEASNLAAEEPERAQAMLRNLREWRRQVKAQENTKNLNFKPELHRAIYAEFDSSSFAPAAASDQDWKKIFHWRQLMDEAVRPSK